MKVLIVAKSYKHNKYCVAGIDVERKKLIRIVSCENSYTGALSDDEVKLYNRSESLKVLDMINIQLEHHPHPLQPENYFIVPGSKIFYIKTVSPQFLIDYLNYPKHIFINTDYRLNQYDVESSNSSLLLVKVLDFKLKQIRYSDGKIKPQGSFKYKDKNYTDYRVTCPKFYNYEFSTDEAILCVSLPPDDYHGYYYKFIAAIHLLSPIKITSPF